MTQSSILTQWHPGFFAVILASFLILPLSSCKAASRTLEYPAPSYQLASNTDDAYSPLRDGPYYNERGQRLKPTGNSAAAVDDAYRPPQPPRLREPELAPESAPVASPAPAPQSTPMDMTREQPAAMPKPTAAGEPVPQMTNAPDSLDDVILSPGDKIKITVFEDESLSGEFQINDNGRVSLPLIGQIQAAGLSQRAFQERLVQEYSQGYLVNPHISVEMLSLRPFYILGEVKAPGVYDYSPSLNAFKAIAIAGGFSPRAKKNSYTIIRGSGDNAKEIRANDLTPILPGDAIRVEERFF
jgi:protein involved in polysaccharide export with SLBB domain